jgi:transposase
VERKHNKQDGSNSVGLDSVATNEKNIIDVSEIVSQDPQVKATTQRKRTFTAHYKQQTLAAYDACETTEERGTLLRKEGLYSSHISSWRRLFKSENENKGTKKAQRVDHLISEIEQLKKKLAQAQAIIDLQKKVSELLGTYILPHEASGAKS